MLKCPRCYSDKIRRHSHTASGRQRFSCKDCNFRTVNPLGIEQFDQTLDHGTVSKKVKTAKKKSRWVITSAQNATPIHQGFYASLKKYCEANNAELVITPFRYKNPTSIFTDKDYDWWDELIQEHLIDRRVDLCEGVTLLGDVQIQPTAKSPLTGLEGFTGTNTCIVGHPKYQFKTVATRQGDMAKIMSTTGAITLPNYTRSKAGKTGHHHHTFAATILETDGPQFYIRQVTANEDGSFTDIDKVYSSEGVQEAPRAASLVLGDLHQYWVNEDADRGTFEGLIPKLNPEKVFIHDALDSWSISHHSRNDPFLRWAKHHNKKDNIKAEIESLAAYLKERMVDGIDYYIVPSNHDDHVTRYIKEVDWRDDLENAEFYLESALYMIRGTEMVTGGTSTPRPFDYWMNKLLPEISVLGRDEGFEIGGVEHGMHGDVGPNGARGSALNLSKIGSKATIGHGHSPCTIDGCYQVGVMAPDMVYAKGPSSWLVSHVLQYADGKRTHVHIINGKYHA